MLVCLVGATATSFLPETLQATLPDTLEVKITSDLPWSRLNVPFTGLKPLWALGQIPFIQTIERTHLIWWNFLQAILQNDYTKWNKKCIEHTFCWINPVFDFSFSISLSKKSQVPASCYLWMWCRFTMFMCLNKTFYIQLWKPQTLRDHLLLQNLQIDLKIVDLKN